MPLIFSSCSKDDDDDEPTVVTGCMDPAALNYNSNATTETTNICSYEGEIVYYHYKSFSDFMIANSIPYINYYDGGGNLLGLITYEYYATTSSQVSCISGNGKVYFPITWTGNTGSNQATWSHYTSLPDGTTSPLYTNIVSPNVCNKIGQQGFTAANQE